jgi:hypothetical protein
MHMCCCVSGPENPKIFPASRGGASRLTAIFWSFLRIYELFFLRKIRNLGPTAVQQQFLGPLGRWLPDPDPSRQKDCGWQRANTGRTHNGPDRASQFTSTRKIFFARLWRAQHPADIRSRRESRGAQGGRGKQAGGGRGKQASGGRGKQTAGAAGQASARGAGSAPARRDRSAAEEARVVGGGGLEHADEEGDQTPPV